MDQKKSYVNESNKNKTPKKANYERLLLKLSYFHIALRLLYVIHRELPERDWSRRLPVIICPTVTTTKRRKTDSNLGDYYYQGGSQFYNVVCGATIVIPSKVFFEKQ